MDKILIIQDSPSINKVLQARLAKEGLTSDAVETAEEGLEKARQGGYVLILLDISLPGMDGFQACKALKSDEHTKVIPVLFMSAKDEDQIRKCVTECGAQGYITMPFQGSDYINKIKMLIKK